MENNQEIKSCSNCLYFFQHYTKNRKYITKVSCGHCTNPAVTAKEKPKSIYTKHCDKWECGSIIKEERRLAIKDEPRHMSERLEEMIIILKDDED